MTPSNRRLLRIAFTDMGGTNWTGGLTYRRNLSEAIRQYAPHLEVHLLTQQTLENAEENANSKVIKYPPASDWRSGRIYTSALSSCFSARQSMATRHTYLFLKIRQFSPFQPMATTNGRLK